MGGIAYFLSDARKPLPASEQPYIETTLGELDSCIAKVKKREE
jgi:hypothetical protein